MEIYFNSCCIITGGAAFINEYAVAMLSLQESDFMSEWPVNVQALLGPASCIVHTTDHTTKPTERISRWYCFILRFHSLCWIKESRDGWCGRGMVYCRMADCNDNTFSLWTPPSSWTTPELQGTVCKKWLQTRIAFERKVFWIHSQIHNLYFKGQYSCIIVLIYHLYHYVSTLVGVYINLGNLPLGTPKVRHRFLPACSLSLERLAKYHFLNLWRQTRGDQCKHRGNKEI